MAYLDSLVAKAKKESGASSPAPASLRKLAERVKGRGGGEPAPGEGPAGGVGGGAENGEDRVLAESYGDVKIYRLTREPGYFYEVPAPKYRGEEKALINALIEIASKVVVFDEPFSSPEQKRSAYFQQVMDIIDATPELRVPPNAKEFYANAVVREMVGYGLIDPLLQDDNLEEIMVLGPGRPVYVFHRTYEMMPSNVVFYDDVDIRDLIDRIARNVGRRIDFASPLLDARLPDGTRVNATVPPASVDGSTVTIRKFKRDPLTVVDLMDLGTLDAELAAFLWLATDGMGARPANVLVAGGTASGKTTTLNVLMGFVPAFERVVSAEEIAELSLPLPHWVRLETRPPGVEGTGEIDLNTLVKNVLHMRPDRIIVGEIRAQEGYTLFSAMNTGHMGSMGTVHANSARETLVRLINPPISVPEIMLSSLNFIVMQQRINDRRKGLIRRVTEIAEVVPTERGLPSLQVLYQWDPVKDAFVSTGIPSTYLQLLSRYTGLGRDAVLQEVATRKRVLEDLRKRGVRGMPAVCDVTQKYLMRQKGRV